MRWTIAPIALSLGIVVTVGVAPAFAQKPTWNLPSLESDAVPPGDAAPAANPRTYPLGEGFEKRRQIIIDSLADEDLSKWRRGYFAPTKDGKRRNDPGKYLVGAAMAHLIKDPQSEQALKFMNDKVAPTEHYHFGAVNWARFLPIFRDALTAETFEAFSQQAKRYTGYLQGGGTENHKVMWYTSGLVLPDYVEADRFALKKPQDAINDRKRWLKQYVVGLYKAGQGEWDSSTYMMFDVNGMLNIYDFSKDEESRLLARAALDWFAAAYAMKYTDGVFTAPNQRGYPDGAVDSIGDQTGWLWWGSNKNVESPNAKFRYAMHPATSAWRPNELLTKLATRNLLQMPFHAVNTKPNYWGGTDTPKFGQFIEHVYVTPSATLASITSGGGGQITPWMLAVSTPDGGKVFSGGHSHRFDHTGKALKRQGEADGIGFYDQRTIIDNHMLLLTEIPKDDPFGRVIFRYPKAAAVKEMGDGVFFLKLGKVGILVSTFGGEAKLVDAEPDKRNRPRDYGLIEIDTRAGGYLVTLIDPAVHGDALDRIGKINKLPNPVTLQKTEDGSLSVKFLTADPTGKEQTTRPIAVTATYDGDAKQMKLQLDGATPRYGYLTTKPTAVYRSPYLLNHDGLMGVTDGKKGYIIDARGEIPKYLPYTGGLFGMDADLREVLKKENEREAAKKKAAEEKKSKD